MTELNPLEYGPSLAEIEQAAEALSGRIIQTPMVPLASDRLQPYLPKDANVIIKLELLQHAGSFKARGALLGIDELTAEQRRYGVTALSGGNHALAVAWASHREGVSAKVVMPKTADPVRVQGCKAFGADVVLSDDIHAAFAEVDRIVSEEGRSQIHPFEGAHCTLGTATCGLELITHQPDLDVVVIPIGGGGLIGGVARACKLVSPRCKVIGVEPFGADTLYRSFKKGEPVTIPEVTTIADSLGAPLSLPYSYAVAKANVDNIVRIDDDDMLRTMALLFDGLKIVPEPACAASTAAVIGPLRKQLEGLHVGVIACGSNIGEDRLVRFLARGRELVEGAG